MRGWLLGAMCAALVVSTPQTAGAFKDGHHLLKFAGSRDIGERTAFTMYVVGVAHGVQYQIRLLQLFPIFCIEGKITNEDAGNAVRIWLRGKPDSLDSPAESVVVWALMEHFPCKKRPSR